MRNNSKIFEKTGIITVPLHVILDEKTYDDLIDITPDDIYAHFEKTGKVGLDILLNMALVLGCLDEFDALLLEEPKPTNLFQEDNTARQRGRLK